MILIVDDDHSVLASMELLFKQHGRPSRGVRSAEEALTALEAGGCDLVIQDMNFSRETNGEEGLALLKRIRQRHPLLPVILITAWGNISLAVAGMKAGAADFITKPWSNAQITQAVETALRLVESGARGGPPNAVPDRAALDRQFDFSMITGEDPAMLRVLDLVGRVAPTNASVLISGESGTGKELIAEALHRNSPRRNQPFVKVNLGGISSSLFESEMFGHVKGAFTDAHHARQGRFELAHGGTIFLDEIGDLELGSQVKLLRILQDRTFEVLGSSDARAVDVRVISATNRDLTRLVDSGGFREDLLYRLNLISVRLPSLRERRGDIPPLVGRFLQRCAHRYGREPLRPTDSALRWLAERDWPGNVRQLEQTLERAVLVVRGECLNLDDLRLLAELETRPTVERSLPSPGSMTLDEMERAMITTCLAHYHGNVTRVAEVLGLSRGALYRRMERYGLHPAAS
jgi:DNA-binding NtrC family response regulator